MKATVQDFETFFAVAKAHGFSFENCRDVALVELGKPLGEYTKEELVAFELRICRGADQS